VQRSATLPVRLDANQAWTPSVAVEMIDALAAEGLDVEFVEQPVLAADIDGLAWVRARSALPIVADEAVFSMADLERVIAAEAADGVNVKLAKCGGPLRAAALVRRAQDAGLATMVGSMMEGPVGVGAAAEVALAVGCSLVNDLDAAWWLADLDDPDFGDVALTYEAGRVVLGRSQRPDEPR
jgi:L-alanine-DL-glutamate epimerase-like enolase superfamily enzyme